MLKCFAFLFEGGKFAERQGKCCICNVSDWTIFQKICGNVYQCREGKCTSCIFSAKCTNKHGSVNWT